MLRALRRATVPAVLAVTLAAPARADVLPVVPAKPARAQPPSALCTAWIAQVERTMRIPHAVLLAVGLVESGWHPWAVDYAGAPVFYESAAHAAEAVATAIGDGQRNIDVGCLQINLAAHPDVFRSLDEAFDPATNVKAGARLLVSLAHSSGSWSRAIELYHSADPALGHDYFCRFHTAYIGLKQLRASPAAVAYCRRWTATRRLQQAARQEQSASAASRAAAQRRGAPADTADGG